MNGVGGHRTLWIWLKPAMVEAPSTYTLLVLNEAIRVDRITQNTGAERIEIHTAARFGVWRLSTLA